MRRPVELFRDWTQRFFAVQGIDRAMAIAAQCYSAFLPLLIVYASVLPRADNAGFADVLIDRFELRGSAAATVHQAFAPAGEVQSSVTALGLVLLLISTLSFTRGLQRLYEGAFGLPPLGARNTARALLWLLIVAVAVWLRPILVGLVSGPGAVIVTIATSTLIWAVTPYLLLGRRLSWPVLLPSASLTAF